MGLNTHEWKYRISDPTIGRFWQIDPLAEDYVYNSTYAFQENKMGMGTELEGLELNPFNTYDRLKGFSKAIKDFAVDFAQSTKYIGSTGAAQAGADFAPAVATIVNDPKGVANAVVNNVKESLKTPEGQGYALGVVLTTVLDPSPAGEAGAMVKTTDKVADVAGDVSKVANKTDFVVTSNGTTIAVPDGATGPSNPNKGTGMVYQGGSGGKGMDKRTTGVRIMDPNGRQGRRVNYMN